jgi:citrate lyase subunit gamma (acyl carrier protein)
MKRRRKIMEIKQAAIAGTLESSDAQVTVEPYNEGLSITIESSVMNQYGRQIKATVEHALEDLNVKNGKITVVDKGALECTLKARIDCAIFRSCGASEENIPWGGMVK